jgi:hypothetical protein
VWPRGRVLLPERCSLCQTLRDLLPHQRGRPTGSGGAAGLVLRTQVTRSRLTRERVLTNAFAMQVEEKGPTNALAALQRSW